ncbi:MAG: hypothetical protein F8N36_13840 [Desulfovibrio sp.]|nr:hypothetical protein [Desulfovibrio sp.]
MTENTDDCFPGGLAPRKKKQFIKHRAAQLQQYLDEGRTYAQLAELVERKFKVTISADWLEKTLRAEAKAKAAIAPTLQTAPAQLPAAPSTNASPTSRSDTGGKPQSGWVEPDKTGSPPESRFRGRRSQ